MDPQLQRLIRNLAPAEDPDAADRFAPLTFDELLGHPDGDADAVDALSALDREIFAGLVTP